MRKVLVPLVLLLLILTGAWFVLGGEAPRTVDQAGVAGTRAATVAADGRSPDREATAAAEPQRARAKLERAEREAMRRRILEALASRDRAAAEQRPVVASEEEEKAAGRRPKSAASAPAEEAPAPGGLADRSGNHGYLLKVMNEELMPLVDECYELARATKPELAGMLVLDAEILGDEDIGGVVESITPGRDNELTDPALNECVRESLLATTLPAPPHGGRDAISLSLRLTPGEPK